jgi:hypothetical protein
MYKFLQPEKQANHIAKLYLVQIITGSRPIKYENNPKYYISLYVLFRS